ncbi:hypothetical protein WICPIJ_002851, partial [Wickerhamomyces pijperi]
TINQYSDVNFWRSPVLDVDDLTDEDSDSDVLKSREDLSSAGSNAQRLGGFFSRSPTSKGSDFPLDESFDDYDENLDPDYVYEDEDELDDDYDEEDEGDDVDEEDADDVDEEDVDDVDDVDD